MHAGTSTPAALPVSSQGILLRPWWMLISRPVFFLLFQLLIALFLTLAGNPSAWEESARWWTFLAIFANIGSIYLLVRLYKAEGKSYFDAIRFSRATWKTDLFWFIVASIIAMPIVGAPREPLAIAIFGEAMTATNIMFRPLPTWAFIISFLFPLTIGFAELPMYFAYCMPRLEKQLKNGWLA